MHQIELKKRLLEVIKTLNEKAEACSACRIGQGERSGLEFASYELECAMDKRKRKDMRRR